MIDLTSHDFESAGRSILEFLHKRFGFDLWMVTRTDGDNWIVLQTEDHGYGVKPGTVFRWADSFCSEMVKGNGPQIAPDSDCVPAYANALIGLQVPIKAYIGVPLINADGTLFGTLCAIDPARKPEELTKEQDLVELLAALLSTILSKELDAVNNARSIERLQVEALSDSLTGLLNRRGWDQLLAKEDERCHRYGHSAAVLIIDLDGLKQLNDTHGHAAGDALIVRAANALRDATRSIDIVARLGGDEFGVIAIESDLLGANVLFSRLQHSFAKYQVKASIGMAVRDRTKGLIHACESADNRMYEEKRKP